MKWLESWFSHNCKFGIVVCAVFRDEAKILSEWIKYHANLGVDHFFLYNHKSEDDYQKVLKPFIEAKLVTLHDAPNEPWIHRFQWQREAYNHFIKNYGFICMWCCYIDLDEFIVLANSNDLREFIRPYKALRIGAIEIKWQCFGTSFVPKINEGELYTDKLILKANKDHPLHSWGKVIARPGCQRPWPIKFTKLRSESVHHAQLKWPYREISVGLGVAQINHYVTRDQDFFYRVRMKIRNSYSEVVSSQLTLEELENEFNQVEDRRIQIIL